MKLWRFIEDVLLPLAAATLMTTWLALWTHWLIRAVTPDQPAPAALAGTLLAAQLGGAWLARLAGRRGWPARRRQIAGTASGGAALLATLLINYPPALWLNLLAGREGLGGVLFLAVGLLAAGGLAWQYGLGLGANTVTRDRLEGAFYGGLLALALLLVVNNAGRQYARGDLVWPVLLFVGVGLGALALTGLRRIRLQHNGGRSEWRAFSRDWALMAFGLTALVLLGGVLLTSLLAPEAFSRVGAVVRSAYDVLAVAASVVLAPFLIVLSVLLTPLAEWLRGISQALAEVARTAIAAFMGLLGAIMHLWLMELPRFFSPERVREIVDSDDFRAATRGGALLSLLVIAALFFWAALRRAGWLTTPEGEEMRESILSRDLIWEQLRRLFTRRRPEPPLPPYLTLDGPPDDPRLRVRQAYQDLLAWAGTYNLARAAGQTPQTYAARLTRALPEAGDAIADVTRAYIQARYGGEPPSPEAARRAEQAVDQVRALSPLGKANGKADAIG